MRFSRFPAAVVVAIGAASGVLVLSCSSGTEPSGIPAQVKIESGDAQTSTAGRALTTPLVVRVLDSRDRGVPGVGVRVTIGSAVPLASATDGEGRASMSPTAAPAAGDQVIRIEVERLSPLYGTVHAVAGAPDSIAPYVGDVQVDTVGRLLAQPLVAVVRDTFGNPVPGATVAWRIVAGDGQLGDAKLATTQGGVAQSRFTLGATARTDSIAASIATSHGSVDAIFTARALLPGATALQVVGGDGQVTTAGAAFAVGPSFRALDAGGHPIPGAVVNVRVVGGGVDAQHFEADSTGVVRLTTWRAGIRSGVDSLVATSGSARAAIAGRVIAGAPSRLVVRRGIADTLQSGTVVGPRVVIAVTDSFANPVPDSNVAPRTVRVSIVSGVGRLARQLSTTSAGDSAVFDSLVVSGGGRHVLRFDADGMMPASTSPVYVEVRPVVLTLAPHVAIVDSGATFHPTLTVTDSVGAVAGAQLRWKSSDTTIARVDTAGGVATLSRGEALVSTRSVYAAPRRDSLLVVTVPPGGPVLATDLDRFSLARDTTFTLTISVDARTGSSLGSATGSLQWNPALFTYVSNAPAAGAPTIAVNDGGAASGILRFAFADANGRAGRTALLQVTLRASGSGSGTLALVAAQVGAADAAYTSLTGIAGAASIPVVVP